MRIMASLLLSGTFKSVMKKYKLSSIQYVKASGICISLPHAVERVRDSLNEAKAAMMW